MINFNTDKIIIVVYPNGAGGKFLINCLGLSDDCVFQSAELAVRQLCGKFTQQDKIAYLLDKLNNTTEKWDDLDLHTPYLFGINSSEYMIKHINDINFNRCIEPLINLNQHYLFITAHQYALVEACITGWPNARIILFENTEKFVSERCIRRPNKFFNIWVEIRKDNWPKLIPNTFDGLEKLPPAILTNLKSNFAEFYSSYVEYLTELYPSHQTVINFKNNFSEKIILWNTNWYFSEKDTVREVGNLYVNLNLNNFNSTFITDYYHAWLNKIKNKDYI